jgi:hypothetical protein
LTASTRVDRGDPRPSRPDVGVTATRLPFVFATTRNDAFTGTSPSPAM